jgi:hypothetical protein
MRGTHTVLMGDRGLLVIPAEVCAEHGFEEGTPLVLLDTAAVLVLLTQAQMRHRVRADLTGLDLVSELLADRRREAVADGSW